MNAQSSATAPLLAEGQRKNPDRQNATETIVGSPWLTTWLYYLKTYFLFVHYAYIMLVAVVGAIMFIISERVHPGDAEESLEFVDALFVAISCVTGTGMSTVDTSRWNNFSSWMRHIIMILGGTVFTSIIAPLLRLATLRRLQRDTIIRPGDSLRRQRWKRRKSRFVERLTTTATICLATTMLYWFSIQIVAFLFLLATSEGYSANFLLQKTISSFQGCTFLSLATESNIDTYVLVFALLCAVGNTLFPTLLRLFLRGERFLFAKCVEPRLKRKHEVEATPELSKPLGMEDGNIVPALTTNPVWDAEESQGLSKWMKGFNAVLTTSNPLSYHHFLFSGGDSMNLFVAWLAIVLVGFLPFCFQQWSGPDGVLAQLSWYNKLLVGFCQSVVVRFAGITYVNIAALSRGHILLILFAMYIPAIPIPDDTRKSKKWKALVGRGVWNLLTSRFWYLFIAITMIVFIEEDRLQAHILGSRWNITNRVIVEVISSHSTSGLSLSIGNAPYSFTGSCTVCTKIIIMLCMLVGRHRGMDLGIDIGFTELEENDKYVREMELRDRAHRANKAQQGSLGERETATFDENTIPVVSDEDDSSGADSVGSTFEAMVMRKENQTPLTTNGFGSWLRNRHARVTASAPRPAQEHTALHRAATDSVATMGLQGH